MPTAKLEATPNGHVGGMVSIPKHVDWITIPDGPYQGLRFRCWINAPYRLTKQLADETTYHKTWTQIYFEHDHWAEEDENGQLVELPPMSDAEAFTDAVSLGLLRAIGDTRMAADRGEQVFGPATRNK